MAKITRMSVLLIVGPKCTLAASHAVPWRATVSMPTDRRTDERTPYRYITLSSMDAVNVIIQYVTCIGDKILCEKLYYLISGMFEHPDTRSCGVCWIGCCVV